MNFFLFQIVWNSCLIMSTKFSYDMALNNIAMAKVLVFVDWPSYYW